MEVCIAIEQSQVELFKNRIDERIFDWIKEEHWNEYRYKIKRLFDQSTKLSNAFGDILYHWSDVTWHIDDLRAAIVHGVVLCLDENKFKYICLYSSGRIDEYGKWDKNSFGLIAIKPGIALDYKESIFS